MNNDIKEMWIAVGAIGAIGVGLWLYSPWVSIVVVGVIVLALTVLGRVLRA